MRILLSVRLALLTPVGMLKVVSDPFGDISCKGDDTLFSSFSIYAKGTGQKIKIIAVKACKLAEPQPRAVKELQDAPIPKTEQFLSIGLIKQPLHLLVGDGFGERMVEFRGVDLLSRIFSNALLFYKIFEK